MALVAGFGAALVAGSFFSLLAILLSVPMAPVVFSVSLSAPANFFLLAILFNVPMAPVAFSLTVSFTLGFLTMAVLFESTVPALLRELRVERGAGGGTAVTLRATGTAATFSVGVTFLVDVLRTAAVAGFGAVAFAVAALALETIFNNMPDAPLLVGDVYILLTGEIGRASCDFGGGGPIFAAERAGAAADAGRSFVFADLGERTWVAAAALVRDTARALGAALTRFFGFSISSFSLSFISSLDAVRSRVMYRYSRPYLFRLLDFFEDTALCCTGDGAAIPGRIAVVDNL